jgi:hypothetical protein
MKRVVIGGGLFFVAALICALVCFMRGQKAQIDKYDVIDRPARIYPDYSSAVIPPNIAPLNFMVQEQGVYYFVRVYSDKGRPIEVFSPSPKIMIPENAWHKLLNDNRSGQLRFDVYVKTSGQWHKYQTINNSIAKEDIDSYLVYRRMHPTHLHIGGLMGIYQRNLSSFDEKNVIDNRNLSVNCVNCHAFCRNRPDKVLMGVREYDNKKGVTLLVDGDKVSKIEAKFGYTSWHPSGRMAAYSINNLPMFFHTARNEVRDTFDITSAIAYYDGNTRAVKTNKFISRKEYLETWPVWSADGRYLYFCTAPIGWDTKSELFPPNGFEKVKYDLVRIGYDIESDKWGEIETVLSAKDAGKSIAMPRVSPNGRWLTFCIIDYGFFPTWQNESDIFIMDLNSTDNKGKYEYRKMEINSDKSESWHSWSSNSRWVAFSSKKEQGVFTRCYLSYVDENGKAYKPLLLPQKDPAYYGSCLEAFNTPELVTGPIAITGERLLGIVRGCDAISVKLPITTATPKAETKQIKDEKPWHE